MAEVKITVFDNGPVEVDGEVTLLNESGEPIPTDGSPIFLCRCGQSSDKPFCDGTHDECGFVSKLTA
jgi:CDGSH-type Zn-finger protein